MQAISKSRDPSSALKDKNQILNAARQRCEACACMGDRIVDPDDVLTKFYVCAWERVGYRQRPRDTSPVRYRDSLYICREDGRTELGQILVSEGL